MLEGGGGEKRVEPGDELTDDGFIGSIKTVERDLDGAQCGELLLPGQLGEIELEQGCEQLSAQRGVRRFGVRLAVLRADARRAGERHQGLDLLCGIALRERLPAPLAEGLMLDGGARSPADEAVVVAEMRPCARHGLRVLPAVECLQLMPQVAQPARLGLRRDRGRRERCGALRARVGHPIQPRLHTAPADGEIHRAVLRMDDGIGQRQR